LLDSVKPKGTSPSSYAWRFWSAQQHYRVSDRYDNSPPDLSPEYIAAVADELNTLGVDGIDEQAIADWQEMADDDPTELVTQILDAYRETVPEPYLSLMDKLAAWAEQLHYEAEGMGSPDDLPTMYDLAKFGQPELQYEETFKEFSLDKAPVEHTRVTWPGKQALLGSSWYGVRYLSNYDGGW
jgi:hypothetical protein